MESVVLLIWTEYIQIHLRAVMLTVQSDSI